MAHRGAPRSGLWSCNRRSLGWAAEVVPAAKMHRREILLVAVIFLALLARLFAADPIGHHGEAREALVARSIVQQHEWILPHRNGDLPSKPPLFHWLAAATELVVGSSDMAVRFPSVIAAVTMAAATFWLGGVIGGRRLAWLAVAALLGMHEFWDSGTIARVDMVFSACVTLSLVSFFLWFRRPSRTVQTMCYLAAALAVLAKGPAGIALPALVILGFLLVDRRWSALRAFWSWPLVGLVLAIDAGWYGLAYRLGGDGFFQLQIQRENIDRILGGHDFGSRTGIFSVLGWLATRLLPWNLALLWSAVRRARGESEDSAGRFLHAWWIAVSFVFTVAAGKRSVYLLPLYPAIALLAARVMETMITCRPGLPGKGAALFCADGPQRGFCTARALAVAILLFDGTLAVVGGVTWKDTTAKKARLAFLQRVNAVVPAGAPLLAVPELEISDVIVIAYRLEREIRRQPLSCGAKNVYYLAPLDGARPAGSESIVLASSKNANLTLLRLLAPGAALRPSSCNEPPSA